MQLFSAARSPQSPFSAVEQKEPEPPGPHHRPLQRRPFGQRRFATGEQDPGQSLEVDWNPAINSGTGNGFTGHEQLDDIGIVHMNGRVFNPRLGLFLQPDPIIQDPSGLQGYNRYGYCSNSPMGCTDPSGLTAHYALGGGGAYFVKVKPPHTNWGRMVAGLVAAYFLGPGGYTVVTGGAYATIANAAVAGFVSGAITSGNMKGAIQGAYTGALFAGVGDYLKFNGLAETSFTGVALHGVVGCVTTAAAGGKCGAGALSASFSQAALGLKPANVAGGTIVSAVIGGTASVLGGGKFANGAQTAAFGYLFNELMHSGYRRYADSPDDRLRQGGYLHTIADDGSMINVQSAAPKLEYGVPNANVSVGYELAGMVGFVGVTFAQSGAGDPSQNYCTQTSGCLLVGAGLLVSAEMTAGVSRGSLSTGSVGTFSLVGRAGWGPSASVTPFQIDSDGNIAAQLGRGAGWGGGAALKICQQVTRCR